jgi:hypothetical protein
VRGGLFDPGEQHSGVDLPGHLGGGGEQDGYRSGADAGGDLVEPRAQDAARLPAARTAPGWGGRRFDPGRRPGRCHRRGEDGAEAVRRGRMVPGAVPPHAPAVHRGERRVQGRPVGMGEADQGGQDPFDLDRVGWRHPARRSQYGQLLGQLGR